MIKLALFDLAGTSITDNNDVALVTFRSSLDLSMTIARAGEVFVSRVSGSSLKVSTSSSESGQ